MNNDLDTLLGKWRDGDRDAGEQVIAFVYRDLRALAAHFLNNERPDHTLQPTALVHEAYLRLASGRPVQWQNRAHFIAVAARQMRRILIDHARGHKAAKRNNSMIAISMSDEPASPTHLESVLALNSVLEELESHDPRVAQIVELRVFGGLTEKEIGVVLDTSLSTVKRDWAFARAWLIRKFRTEHAVHPGGVNGG
jgi:RNA polymerase sigma factor (TIGR02999 family)